MTERPKVSVLIPTYNREGYLDAAITSALAQTYSPVEVVVSDNASTDRTAEVVGRHLGDPRLRYYRNDRNIGMVGNWRKAVHEYLTGDYFLILSDDDFLIDSAYLADAVDLIMRNPSILAVVANGYLLDESTQTRREVVYDYREVNDGVWFFLNHGKTKEMGAILCTTLYHTAWVRKLGFFGNPYNTSVDREILYTLGMRGDIGFVARPVAVYRQHAQALSTQYLRNWTMFANVMDFIVGPYREGLRLGRFTHREVLRRNPALFAKFHIARLIKLVYRMGVCLKT